MNVMDKPKIDKVEQIKQARKEITLVPKKYQVTDVQSPSPFITIPSRALNDKRILSSGSALEVLCVLCSYISGSSGTAFPSQYLLAERLARSQQAISRQMVKLIEWGYVKKIVKENALRQSGRKGATYRVIYDPKVSDRELIAKTNDPIVEQRIAEQTLNKTLNKSWTNIEPQESKKEEVIQHNSVVPRVQNSQRNSVVSNSLSLTNIYNKEKIKEYLETYSHALDRYGTRGTWRWTEREEVIAEEIMNAGVTVAEFRINVSRVLSKCKKEYKRPPYTIAYFKSIWIKKDEPKTSQDIAKELGKKMKLKYSMYKT